MKLLTSILFGTVSVCTLCSGSDAVTDRLPDFRWDTVPLYMHVRKAAAFTPEEIRYLASFPLITFEKTTGTQDTGITEKGTLRAAQAVKAPNPRTKIPYYRNILVHYLAYDAIQPTTISLPRPHAESTTLRVNRKVTWQHWQGSENREVTEGSIAKVYPIQRSAQ